MEREIAAPFDLFVTTENQTLYLLFHHFPSYRTIFNFNYNQGRACSRNLLDWQRVPPYRPHHFDRDSHGCYFLDNEKGLTQPDR